MKKCSLDLQYEILTERMEQISELITKYQKEIDTLKVIISDLTNLMQMIDDGIVSEETASNEFLERWYKS